MHPLLFDQLLLGSINGHSPQDLLKVYCESKYGKLNNLDPLRTQIRFPTKSHMASVNSLSLERQTNRYMLSGGGESSVKLWDLQQEPNKSDKGEEQPQYEPVYTVPPKSAHRFGITHLKWWPDNGMWLSSSYDFTLKLFDSTTMSEVHSFDLGSRVLNFDFGSSGTQSLVGCCIDGGIGGIRLLDLRTLADAHTLGGGGKLQGGYGHMLSCCWSPTNSNLVVGGSQDGYCIGWDIRRSDGCVFKLDNNLTVNNYRNNDMQLQFHDNIPKAHNGGINSVMFNDLGTEIVSLGNDEKIRVWDLTTANKPLNKSINFGPLIRNKYKQHITMCLSPTNETDLQYLWVPSDNGEMLIYRVNDGKLIARLNKRGQGNQHGRTTTIVYSKECSIQYYSGAIDGSISIWGYDDSEQRTLDDEDVVFDNGVDYKEDDPGLIIHNERRDILDRIKDEMDANEVKRTTL